MHEWLGKGAAFETADKRVLECASWRGTTRHRIPHLDWHAGAVKCEGEQHTVTHQAMEVSAEVGLGQREGVAPA